MKYQINKAVVVGAGTMGAALAAHLANAGTPTTLLDIVPFKLTPDEEKKGLTRDDKAVRYRIVNDGLTAAKKSRPASFFSSDQHTLVSVGNLEDDFDAIAEADLVVEAIIENLEIKQDLMKRIDAVRKPNAIIATNTSGIPVKDIAAGLSDGFKQHFLGMHFFNPPRYLKLLEVIPTDDTLPEVIEFVSWFGEYRLGKGIVLCKDTPNFIGNRVAFGTGAFALDYILKNDLTIEEVDMVTGPIIGRPKTATFRLIDLVGIDVWDHVGRNLAPLIQHDKYALLYLEAEAPNALIADMVKRGWLGNKTRGGFYNVKKDADGKKTFLHLNFKTMEYEEGVKPRFDSVGAAKKAEDLKGIPAGEDLRAVDLVVFDLCVVDVEGWLLGVGGEHRPPQHRHSQHPHRVAAAGDELLMLHGRLAGGGIDKVMNRSAAYQSFPEGFAHFFTVGPIDGHPGSGVTIKGVNNDILRYIDQTTGQIAGIGGTQGGIGQTFTGAVRGDEIFQRGQSFAEVGANGQGNDAAAGVGHQATHPGQLTDRLKNTS